MSHGPIEEKQRQAMNDLARILDQTLNRDGKKRWGFALLVYHFGEPSRMNYIGNGKRADMLVALKELVARWEGRFTETHREQ